MRRIYTRGGDQGKTGLMGGKRRFKHDVRVHSYGAVDEAGAFIGLATAYLRQEGQADLAETLLEVSQVLWDVGADLSMPPDTDENLFRTPADAAAGLEPFIDKYQEEAQDIRKFVLRGGSMGSAYLHVACTVVRRAERHVVELMQTETINPAALKFLNRLSDLLFAMARVANERTHTPDIVYRNSPDVFR